MKKLLVLILAALLCVTSVAVMAEEDELPKVTLNNTTQIQSAEFPFKDVAKDIWYFDAVKTAYEMKLINGKGATDTYKPDDNMTYAEAIKLAACMHQLHTTGSVTLGNGSVNWYDTYVEYCKNNSIITKDYNYGDMATRSGYMEIFANALPSSALEAINNVPDNFIPDVKMDAPYAAAVYKLYRAGILAGVDAKNNCAPASNIKRSEVAVILTRMMVKEKRVSVGLPKEELSAGTLSAEDQKIYNQNKSTIEAIAKNQALSAAIDSTGIAFYGEPEVQSNKVIKSDSYFRYVIGVKFSTNSIAGNENHSFEVLIRVSTDLETYEISKIKSKITEDDMRAAGWGTRPADFGTQPEE
ncbi:MAG: S-layer homology domain-containing protein [Clostridia bacterium]|nr:S-layer homology domain-containing protein [Clostridia bacterium]